MASKKSSSNKRNPSSSGATTSARATAGGPARRDPRGPSDALTKKFDATGALAEAMPFNPNKPAEYGRAATQPRAGATVPVEDPRATGSTLTESIPSAKAGSGKPNLGKNPGVLPLDRVRSDASGQRLTTNLGVPVADNQHSLKAGLRGPALLEDFILREKITHFDHERIPERIVHARGSAAHGYFECYKPMTEVTRASIFAEAGKRTPVFVRFSTVAGERGSKDTARDIRGFAV
jgi:catalase